MRALSRLSPLPRHRRWRRLLRSLALDPDDLPKPVASPGPHDVVICGCPRTGTALVAAMLHRPPSSMSVMEPWDALRLPPAELFASLRAEMRETGWLRRGRLDVDALAGGAVEWVGDGGSPHRVDYRDESVVTVKMPALWRYLDLLAETRFVVCVRDPAATVASMAETSGRLALGLDYDVAFNRVMNESLLAATDDPARRRLLLYDYVNARVLPHLGRANVFTVRYERWFTDADAQFAELCRFLGVHLDGLGVRIRGNAVSAAGDADAIRRASTTAAALGYGA